MEENLTKRKTKTSSQVKQRYNEKVYDVLSVRVPKDMAAAFKAKCTAEGIPQAQIIKRAIEDFLNS
jgi:predicted DNA binding CopG/RHH family protein